MGNEYIKMCFWNDEIQALWKPKIGDETIWKPGLTPHMIDDNDFKGGYDSRGHPDEPKYHVWLPRQEDLQEIYMKHVKCSPGSALFDFLVDWFYLHYENKDRIPDSFSITTMWLCFVMETCYGKRWNGKTWEKIG